MSGRTMAWMRALALSVLGWGAAGWARAADESGHVLVFAAASLTEVVDQLSRAFTAQSKVSVNASYAASSALAKQIEAGAPADVFFSADTDWVDYLEKRNLLQPGTRHNVVTNRLVLIAPANSQAKLHIGPDFRLAAALGASGRLATGDPDSVPVGKYARTALQRLGVWDQIANRLVRAENVRAALAFVARGEAPLGIVYATDARAEHRVKVIDVFPADSHPPIIYPLALTVGAAPQAAHFAAFVSSEAGDKVFRNYGFQPLH